MNIQEIYEMTNNDLRNRRSKAIQDAEYCRQKAIQNAEYLEIANKIGELTIMLGKERFYGNDTSKIEKEYKLAKKKESEILKKIGLNQKDLEPQFFCKDCEDKGVFNNKRCHCFNDLLASNMNKYNMNIFNPITFKDCELIDKKILDTMQQLVENYPNNKNYINVLITGDVGVGKTQLTQAVANAFLEKGVYTIFTSANTLNTNFLDYHKCFDEYKTLYLHHYIECDVLIIDDLGTEPMLNNVTKEYLLMLVGERILAHRLTIISTNLDAKQLIDRYGERIVSRLLDHSNSISMIIKGKDLRLKTNK